MGEKLNQHWVPQHHLRLFSDGERYIHLVSRDGSRLVERASVKGQCARPRFYGDIATERRLSDLENRHAVAYRRVVKIARGDRGEPLRTAEERTIREALLLQKARTPRNAQMHADAGDQAILYAYHEYLRTQPHSAKRAAVMRAIEEGRASLPGSESRSLVAALDIASKTVGVITDLRLLILKNTTDTPFVMGDTPCLASNHYMRDVTGVGVVGLSKRGLMISIPLDSRTHVLLFDRAVYRAARCANDVVDVTHEGDVNVLNALQVHGAQECVYFSYSKDRDYVRDFVASHPARSEDHRGGFHVLRSTATQLQTRDEILHAYEPQLPVTLALSFLKTQSLPPALDVLSARKPKRVEHLERAYEARDARPTPTDMDEIVRLVEAELIVT
jgi:hypothetical protein